MTNTKLAEQLLKFAEASLEKVFQCQPQTRRGFERLIDTALGIVVVIEILENGIKKERKQQAEPKQGPIKESDAKKAMAHVFPEITPLSEYRIRRLVFILLGQNCVGGWSWIAKAGRLKYAIHQNGQKYILFHSASKQRSNPIRIGTFPSLQKAAEAAQTDLTERTFEHLEVITKHDYAV